MAKKAADVITKHGYADLAQRIQDLDDEVEDLYVQYFETPDENDFDSQYEFGALVRALRRIAERLREMAYETE